MEKQPGIDESVAMGFWAGRVSADAFVRATAPHWHRMTVGLWRSWRAKLPASVEFEDIEQTVVMLALAAVRRYDPARGSIGAYVTWSAQRRAVRAIAAMRGASTHGNAGKNPGAPEQNFSRVAARRMNRNPDAPGFDPTDLVPVEPRQVDDMIIDEVFETAIGRSQSTREALVLAALRQNRGAPDSAAEDLYEEFATRVECEFLDIEHARREVSRVVERVVGQLVSAA